MAVLTNPLPWGTRAIGFDAFGGLATFSEGAQVILVSELGLALSLSS